MHSPIPEQVMDGLQNTEQSLPKHPSKHWHTSSIQFPIPEQAFRQGLLPALTEVQKTMRRTVKCYFTVKQLLEQMNDFYYCQISKF